MMAPDEEILIDDVMARAPFRDRGLALQAIAATLEKLAACLPRGDAQALAEELPEALRTSVQPPRRRRAPTIEALVQHVSQREEVELGLAVEHAEAVLAALGDRLPFEVRGRLHRHLPHAWARLLEPRLFEPPGLPPSRGLGSTLAEGRAGSRRPLSEAAPPGPQSQSVGAQNPHANRKLSSTPGPEDSHSLASGRPGSERPVAETPRRRREH
jgi:uncharacterized protein (DUF2267 family)